MQRIALFTLFSFLCIGCDDYKFQEVSSQDTAKNSPVISSPGSSPGAFLPRKADEAISQSQRNFQIKFPLFDSTADHVITSAFLVREDGTLATVLHGMHDENIIAHHPELTTLNVYVLKKSGVYETISIPAKLQHIDTSQDIAIFKLTKIPRGMKPVVFAKKISRGMIVYAKLFGFIPHERNLYIFFQTFLLSRL